MGGCVTQLILNSILLYQSVVTPGKRVAASKASSGSEGAGDEDTAAAVEAAATEANPPVGGAGMARGRAKGFDGSSGTAAGGVGENSSDSIPNLIARTSVLQSTGLLAGAGGPEGGANPSAGLGGGGLPQTIPAAA